jgi:Ca-activated chloride channel homolog
MNFRFEHPEYLWVLVLVPIVWWGFRFVAAWRKAALARLGDASLVARLLPNQGKQPRPTLQHGLLLAALIFLIIGWANPQTGGKLEKTNRKSADIFIALDISQSMLSDDVRPSRLERARQFTSQLVESLKGERIGIIAFAGNAYLQMPLTTDYAAALLFIKSANPEMAPTQGTAIADAIDLAEQSFQADNKHNKALVIITDGEEHDGDALDRAAEANENGLLVFTVGAGTSEGGFIPTYYAGKYDYKRDEKGEPVRTKINETMLQTLAEKGKGSYLNLANDTDRNLVAALKTDLERVQKRELEQRSYTDYESYFYWFLWGALFCLVIETVFFNDFFERKV